MGNDSLLPNLACLHWFWQSTLCIGIGLLGSILLRQRPTRAHQVLFWSMTAAIILPVLSALVKHYNLGLIPPETNQTTTASTSIPSSPEPLVELAPPNTMTAYLEKVPAIHWEPTVEQTSMVTDMYSTPLAEETYSAKLTDNSAAQTSPPIPTSLSILPMEKKSIPWTFGVIGGWILITAILLSRLLLNFIRGFRLLYISQPIDLLCIKQALHRAKSKLRIRQPVRIFQSNRIKTPVIWCWFSCPILLIPEQIDQSDKKIDWVSVFCHELAHWKRHDHWCCLIAELLVCIFWPNPLVWWAKQRLIRLSEHACDDWVVAAGQSKTDYADSLLNLVPQGRMTLVPTVIGGKKEMKNRIKRIIQDRADNPRLSARWTGLFVVLALGSALGLALTQTRAAERDEDQDRITREKDEERINHPEEREREEREARFQHLSRELEELKDAKRNTERRLKGLQDGQDEEARELQEQLRRIQREMTDVKRSLYESTREKQGDREREHAERAERRQALAREMQEFRERAEDIEHEMKELGDRHPDRRQELQNEQREIHEHMNNLERDMQGFDRERAELRDREMHEQEMARERWIQERHELEQRSQEIRHALKELGDENPEQRRNLERELDKIQKVMHQLERKTHKLEQKRHAMMERDLQEREAHQEELMIRRKNLQERLEQLERERKETDNDEKTYQFKREIKQAAAELREIENQLQQERPDREPSERLEMERHLADLKNEIRHLAEAGKHDQAEQLEREFRQAQSELQQAEIQLKQDRMQMLQRLDEIKKEMMLARQQDKQDEVEHLERETQEIQQRLKEQPTLPRLPRKPDMLERNSRRRMSAEPRPELEAQIRELQGQVNEMRQEMKEIRGLLRELLEQKRERQF